MPIFNQEFMVETKAISKWDRHNKLKPFIKHLLKHLISFNLGDSLLLINLLLS